MSDKEISTIQKLYQVLIDHYGPQGWWPILDLQDEGINPTKRGKFTGYHPGDYTIPRNENTAFEIMLGAILTQNTSWVNAEKALADLSKESKLTPSTIRDIDQEDLGKIIRSSGYYNQKATRLHILCAFLKQNPIKKLHQIFTPVLRKKLIKIKGIGPETADSILLYADRKSVV